MHNICKVRFLVGIIECRASASFVHELSDWMTGRYCSIEARVLIAFLGGVPLNLLWSITIMRASKRVGPRI